MTIFVWLFIPTFVVLVSSVFKMYPRIAGIHCAAQAGVELMTESFIYMIENFMYLRYGVLFCLQFKVGVLVLKIAKHVTICFLNKCLLIL